MKNIKMLSVSNEIVNHGFTKVDFDGLVQLYKIVIPQTFRGKYTLFICAHDIYGAFQGMSTQDHDFSSLMDKLSFRSPGAVEWTKNLLYELREKNVINFEEE